MFSRSGFTLIEALVVILVMSMLFWIAAPGFQRLIAELGVERSQHRIAAGLALARTLAITRRTPMTICHLDREGRCDGAWSDGYSIFADPLPKGRLGDQSVERHFTATHEQLELRAFRTRRYLRFLANGQTDWQNGRFIVCARRPDVPARTLVLNVQGRVRLGHLKRDEATCQQR